MGDIQRSMIAELRLPQPKKPKLHLLIPLLQKLLDGTNHPGINQDHQPHSEISLNSTLDPAMTGILHMSQPTMDIQRFMIAEPKLPLPKRLKLLLLTPLLQKLSDGINQLGINQDHQLHLETFFNLILKVSSELDSRVLLTSRFLQPPTLAQMQTKQLLKTKTAPHLETQHGILSPHQELPNQKMPWLTHTQDMLNIEIDK